MNEIIAGADGSAHSLAAVEWAAAEAARHDLPLRIVCAIPQWVYDWRASHRYGLADDWRRHYKAFLGHAEDKAREIAPTLDVSSETVPGQAASALLKAAEQAAMIVVAGRGIGELSGLVLGSTVTQVVSHASCPVAVVGSPEPAVHREVVVGVDGSQVSRRAIDFAFQEASLRKARLRAVHAWTGPVADQPGDMLPLIYDMDVIEGDERRVLAECLAGRAERYPDVEVIEDTVRARPVRALAGASARADLLVVGGRGRGGFAGLLLGSVSQAMLVRSHCPLVIIPERG
jgi:nucleotide-binding universal stress UspA family protein